MSRVAVVITDNPSMDQPATLVEAQRTRQASIGIITVGVGNIVDLYELSAMASYPYSKNMFTVKTALNMTQLVNPILDIICSSEWPECNTK